MVFDCSCSLSQGAEDHLMHYPLGFCARVHGLHSLQLPYKQWGVLLAVKPPLEHAKACLFQQFLAKTLCHVLRP